MSQDEILIGAAGQMFALQIPENGGFTETPVKFGSIKRGISGAATIDRQGTRSEFTWSAEDLNEDDCSLLRQLFEQVRDAALPVRLVLPHRKNLLTASASSALSVPSHRESAPNYDPLNLGYTAVSKFSPFADAAYPVTPKLSSFVEIVNSGGDSDYVFPEGNPGTNPWTRVPLIEGRQYTLSILYRRTVAGVLGNDSRLRNIWRADDGYATGAPAGSTALLNSSTWAWQTLTVTVPVGWPTFVPIIECGDAATLRVAAMQLEEGATRTSWVMGSGVPVVTVTSLSFTDTLWPLRTATMTMTEL